MLCCWLYELPSALFSDLFTLTPTRDLILFNTRVFVLSSRRHSLGNTGLDTDFWLDERFKLNTNTRKFIHSRCRGHGSGFKWASSLHPRVDDDGGLNEQTSGLSLTFSFHWGRSPYYHYHYRHSHHPPDMATQTEEQE